MKVLASVAALTVLVATAAAAPAHAGPPPDAPSPVTTCGQTLTGHHYLTGDLACDGVGFRVTGEVTLDLAGYTLDGGGSGTAFELPLDWWDADVRDTFAVTGGHVRGWDTGFHAATSGASWMLRVDACELSDTGLVFDNNEWGGLIELDGCTVHDNAAVFDLEDFSTLDVTGSVLERNAVVVRVHSQSANVSFEGSTLTDNPRFAETGGTPGLSLHDSTISGSDVVVDGWVQADVVGNTFLGNGLAVSTGSLAAQVRENVFEGNGTAYTATAPGGGIGDGTAYLTDNVFRRNGDAVVTEPGSRVELGGNVAVYNTGWGIYAPGATDLGGNVARGNGRSPQCTGVVCTRPRS